LKRNHHCGDVPDKNFVFSPEFKSGKSVGTHSATYQLNKSDNDSDKNAVKKEPEKRNRGQSGYVILIYKTFGKKFRRVFIYFLLGFKGGGYHP
jgi:hypothetical protein